MLHRDGAPGVVLAPHPDDAVLSAWSALRSPSEVVVVNVCTAVPPAGVLGGADRLLGATDSAAHMRLRLDEDADAIAAAGCTRVNLDFSDGQFRDVPLATDDLAASIGDAVDEVAWICAPAGLGGHGDHVAVRDVAITLAAAASVPLSLYADLPYAVEWGWPHWVTGVEARPFLVPDARWDRDLDSIPVGRERLVPRVHALDAREAAVKLAAVERYRTQFAWLNAGPLDRIRNPEVLGFELSWDVVPVSR